VVAAGRDRVSSSPDVLVVGAGPTGLALAVAAHAHGARVRVVECRPDAFRPSRALIVHARTLEVLRPLGVVDALLERADTAPAARVHVGRRVVAVRLAGFDLPETAYPHLSLLRQADVEAVLGAALGARGVPVQRGTELVGSRTARRPVRGPRCAVLTGSNGCAADGWRVAMASRAWFVGSPGLGGMAAATAARSCSPTSSWMPTSIRVPPM
jgi:2-polyprenyl-6-methoxyphenol hydroxylase-like FAD-dependent oxidoreductase